MSKPGEDPTPFESLQMYERGWTDGAGGRAMDPNRHKTKTKAAQAATLRPELVRFYDTGYTDGVNVRKKSLKEAADALGYEPTILRVQEGGKAS